MDESNIESSEAKRIKQSGGWCLKFVSPGVNGVPDRIVLFPIGDEEHKKIVAKYFRFIEFKALGKKPNKSQPRRHKTLRNMGFIVDVIDKKEKK